MRATLALASLATLALGQGPGDGVSKTTYSCSDPFVGLAFNLRYYPVTAAYDSGHGNVQFGTTIQGRSQLTKANQYAERNCHLYSAASGAAAKSGATNMAAPAALGDDCTYTTGHAFGSASTLLWDVYAYNADICCKACAATKGCVAATYDSQKTLFDAPSAAATTNVSAPMPFEGFGLHLVNVQTAKTTGGIDVSVLEGHYTKRMGGYASYDAFMDFSAVLWCGDLPGYAKRFAADGVKFLAGSWKADTGDTWYSLIVQTPGTQMIVELVGKESPAVANHAELVDLEARMSPRQIARFASATGAAGVLEAVSVNRAVSNMTSIEFFYEQIVKLSAVHTVDAAGVARRCYGWTDAKSDVCFTQRPATAPYDATFSVADMEAMIWGAHKVLITGPTASDKYNDNHYAVDIQVDLGYIAKYFDTNYAKSFPIAYPYTQWAWDCDQNYLIDPTGWAIQSDAQFSTQLPGCEDFKRTAGSSL